MDARETQYEGWSTRCSGPLKTLCYRLPGEIRVQNLAPRYRLSTVSAWSTTGGVYTANGTGINFAIGEALAKQQPAELGGPLMPMAATLPPVSAQVTSFLARWAVDGRALYAVWAGASSTDTGSTDGMQRGIKVQRGHNMSSGSLGHGPLAGLAREEITVDAYQEAVGNFTAMQCGEKKRGQLHSSIGHQWHGTTEVGGQRFRPARLRR